MYANGSETKTTAPKINVHSSAQRDRSGNDEWIPNRPSYPLPSTPFPIPTNSKVNAPKIISFSCMNKPNEANGTISIDFYFGGVGTMPLALHGMHAKRWRHLPLLPGSVLPSQPKHRPFSERWRSFHPFGAWCTERFELVYALPPTILCKVNQVGPDENMFHTITQTQRDAHTPTDTHTHSHTLSFTSKNGA